MYIVGLGGASRTSANSTPRLCRTNGVLWKLRRVLTRLIDTIVESGVARADSARRRNQSRAANVLAVGFTVVGLLGMALAYTTGALLLAALTALTCVACAATFPFNRRGWSMLARATPFACGTAAAGFWCLALTPTSQVQWLLLVVGSWPFVLFDARSERRLLIGLGLLPAVLFVSVNAGFAPHIGTFFPSVQAPASFAQFVSALVFLLNAGLLYCFHCRPWVNEDALTPAVNLGRAGDAATVAERTKTEFLAVMSHEVRTPLHAVLGCAELVRGEPLGKDQEHWMRTLTNSAEYLLELMTNIIEYSRMDGTTGELHETQVDVRTLIEDALGAFAEAIAGKGVDLWLTVEDNVPAWLFLDPGRVRLVVACLASNAAKFTNAGHVAVVVSYRPTDDQRGHLSVRVEDTGIGIEPSAHQRIFEMFRQVDTFEKRRQGGIGLGLTLSKTAAEIMNGELTFASTPGSGTRFVLSVPTKVAHAERLVSRASLAAEALSRLSVRVVTKNPEWTRALAVSFTQWGHVVVPDSDQPSDVLVVDKRMFGETVELDAMRQGNERVFVLTGGSLKAPGVVSLPRFLRRSEWFVALHSAQTAPWSTSLFPSMVNSERISERDFRPPEQRRERLSEPVHPKLVPSLLIADDQITNQKILRKLAEALAERVTVVDNGQLAVEVWEREQPAVILMDVQMPVMDGLEATRQIRARETSRRTPIIAVTANALPEQRAEGLAAGMDVYLTKPIRLDELRLALAQHVLEAREEVA